MQTPLLPREKNQDLARAGAHSEALSSSANLSGGAQPAADWICVAAARNVLVVDDNDRHLDIISTILSSVGNDIETCGSGAEALRRLDMHRYDVVVLDLVMPEVSGLVVAQQMRQLTLSKKTPIVVCTANMTIARRQMAEVPGVTAIIAKPIDTASLVLAVARAPVREHERRSDQIRF
ncbi:MAG: response regulator [Hyphomonadaceae bacterium]|nr:response regulator [Hyphomonadaceae bacterium]